jgi:hypothetical protein
MADLFRDARDTVTGRCRQAPLNRKTPHAPRQSRGRSGHAGEAKTFEIVLALYIVLERHFSRDPLDRNVGLHAA